MIIIFCDLCVGNVNIDIKMFLVKCSMNLVLGFFLICDLVNNWFWE